MKIVKVFLFVCLIVCLPQAAIAEQVIYVSVTTNGIGKTEAEAISDAVINAVAQVNGESIASSMRMKKTTKSSTDQGTKGDRTIEKDLVRKTQGVVKSWRKISASTSSNYDFAAIVAVNVVVLKYSDQLKRIKLAVVPDHLPVDEISNSKTNGIDTTSFEKSATSSMGE